VLPQEKKSLCVEGGRLCEHLLRVSALTGLWPPAWSDWTLWLQLHPKLGTLTALQAIPYRQHLGVHEAEGTWGMWAGVCGGQVLFMEPCSIHWRPGNSLAPQKSVLIPLSSQYPDHT